MTSVIEDAAANKFYEQLPAFNVRPLWRQPGLLPAEPRSRARPHLWPYDDVRALLMQAGDVVTAEEAERRVLMLLNPGLDGEPAAANNLYAGMQLVLPGESAPNHRHAASALRFVVEGSGASTTVDGERAVMEVGDLVLTPAGAWHDHGNQSAEAMVWLDGLDLPLINKLEANFFENAEDKVQTPRVPDNASARLYARARLNPTWVSWDRAYSPILNYPWRETERLLAAAAEDWPGSASDGVIFEYSNPYTGGPALVTLSCFIQQLAGGFHGDAHQHTTSAVYYVVRGHGETIVDGQTLNWKERDVFAVPGWSIHEHVNGSASDPAILFSFTDEAALRPLGYVHERPADRH